MSLIKCQECGRDVSDKAKTCPNCGCPINRFQNEKDFPTYTLIAYLFFAFFGISMIFLHIGWIINTILMVATFVYSIVALKSKEKLCILSAIPLIISGISIAMFLLGALI